MRLLLLGLWWRRGAAAALLVTATVTTAVAALGPLYARAAGESILQDHLADAGYRTGLHLTGEVQAGSTGAYDQLESGAPRPGALNGYDQRIAGLFTRDGSAAIATGSPLQVVTSLAWRDGACAHLVLVSGRCPARAGEAIASQRTADASYYGFRKGGTVRVAAGFAGGDPTDTTGQNDVRKLRIVGVYRPRDIGDPYWFGTPYFDAHVGAGDAQADTVDALFVTRSEFLGLDIDTNVEAEFDYPLTRSAVRLATAGHEVQVVRSALTRYTAGGVLTARSSLPSVLTAADRERSAATVSTVLVTVQLALLSWLVLFQVVSDAIEARGTEIAMAKLRGLSPARTVGFALGEPMVLVAAALPLGLLAAVLVTHAFGASVLVPGVPVAIPGAALLAALVAFLGGACAALAAGGRALRRSVLEQWRRTERSPGRSRIGLTLDLVIAIAAIVGLLALRRSSGGQSGHQPATTLLAPGLLVVAVALPGVRLLPLVCRRLAARTRGSRRIGIFLAVRQVARRAAGLRLAALLAVAAGLALFAVAGESVAGTNRAARAHAELGAPRTVSVALDADTDPVKATEQVDPDGRWAMAAATWLPDGGDSVSGAVLAVDARRWGRIGYSVAEQPAVAALARVIGAAPVPSLTFRTTAVRVHLRADGLRGDRLPYLTVNLRKPGAASYNVDGAALRPGTQAITVPVRCPAGCLLRGLTWNRNVDATTPESGTITTTGIDVATGGSGTTITWRPLDIHLGTSGSWRAAPVAGQASDRLTSGPAGIRDQFTNRDGGYGGIAYNDAPSPMPAVATPGAITRGTAVPDPRQLQDTSQNIATFRVDRTVGVLPAVLNNGVVMDTRWLLRELPGFALEAKWQVWLGPDAPADALARLDRVGLHPQHARTAAARIRELGRQGPALALLLLLVCAAAGAVLAVGGTATAIFASSRRRAYENAALRAVGVRSSALLRAATVEQLLLLGAAMALAVPAGVVAARLAMPHIPQFADRTPVALDYVPHWLPVAAFAGGLVALLLVTAVVAARGVQRASVPARLREVEA